MSTFLLRVARRSAGLADVSAAPSLRHVVDPLPTPVARRHRITTTPRERVPIPSIVTAHPAGGRVTGPTRAASVSAPSPNQPLEARSTSVEQERGRQPITQPRPESVSPIPESSQMAGATPSTTALPRPVPAPSHAPEPSTDTRVGSRRRPVVHHPHPPTEEASGPRQEPAIQEPTPVPTARPDASSRREDEMIARADQPATPRLQPRASQPHKRVSVLAAARDPVPAPGTESPARHDVSATPAPQPASRHHFVSLSDRDAVKPSAFVAPRPRPAPAPALLQQQRRERSVEVSIGTIEVHAEASPSPPQAPAPSIAAAPSSGFEEFARLRSYQAWNR